MSIRRCTISICPITDDVYFDHLITVLSTLILLCKIVLSPLCNYYIFCREVLWNYKYSLSSNSQFTHLSKWMISCFNQWFIICYYHHVCWSKNWSNLASGCSCKLDFFWSYGHVSLVVEALFCFLAQHHSPFVFFIPQTKDQSFFPEELWFSLVESGV